VIVHDPLPVLFRKMKGATRRGEITAVFPTVPGTNEGGSMTCYAHVGQHGACSWGWYRATEPAKPEEYADLLAELKLIYERDLGGEGIWPLKVVRRITPQMRDQLREEQRRLRP